MNRFVLLLLLLLAGCSSEPGGQRRKQPEQIPPARLDSRRLEVVMKQAAAESRTASAMAVFAKYFRADRAFILCWLEQAPPQVADTVNWARLEPDMADMLVGWAADKHIQQLIDSVLAVHPPDHDPLASLASPLGRFHHYFPKAPLPRVRSMVWGHDRRQPWGPQYLANRLYYDGRYLGVGLEYFCGPKFPILHPETPQFIRRRLTPEALPAAAMTLIAERLQPPLRDDQAPTLLDRMVQAGVRYYFLDQMLPDAPDSLKFQYSAAQTDFVTRSEALIYKALIPLLYSKNGFEYGWVMADGPNSTGHLPDAAPARVGHFIGRQIVRKYMDAHPEVTLPDLMRRTDFEAIFQAAAYKPGVAP